MSILDRIRRHPRLAALLQIDDTPMSIALGAAVGMFIALTPTVGIQMYVAVVACFLLRCNRLWAIAMVWISNPITMIPLYYGFYMFGCLLMGSERLYGFDRFRADFEAVMASDGFRAMLREFWNRLVEMGVDVTLPMFVGGAVIGVIFSIPTYFIVYRLAVKNRDRKAANAVMTASSEASVSTDSSDTQS